MRHATSSDLAWPLVGRTRELEALDAALEQAPARLAITGALGLGKSRLLQELEARAEERGLLVLSGRGSEYEQGVPYGVAVDALDDYLGALQPAQLARLGDDLAGELASVFPALAPAGGASAPALETERYRAHRAVRGLLDRMAELGPLVLALDDLHWADGETLELVAHLLRHPPRSPVLLAFAYRPAQVPETLPAAVERARREGGCDLLELEPLTPAQAEEMLGALPAPKRAAIFHEGGGNPFFLEQLARADGAPVPEAGMADAGVPGAVAAALQTELESLGDHERALLSGGAVAGEPFEIGLAARAAGMTADAALPALDRLLAADLVRSTASPRRFEFRHPLVRRAVYQAAGAGWRLAAHGRVAEELRASGAPVTALADHVARSATIGDEEAVATLIEAGQVAEPRAPATAAHSFQAALDLLPPAEGERRLALRVSLASALGSAGRLEDARNTLSDVLGSLSPEQRELRARGATFVARIDHALGRQGEARALLERTLAELPEPRSAEAATITLELVMDHLFTAEFEPMRERAREALALSQELGDPLVEAAAWAGAAHAAQNLGDLPASLEAVRRGAALLDHIPDDDCPRLLDTFWWLATAEDVLELWHECVPHMERGIELARRYGMGYVFVALTQSLAVALGWHGPLGRARETAQAAVDAAHLSGNDTSVAYAYTTQCFVLTQSGEGREAVHAGELAVEAARELRQGLYVALPHANLAAALLEAGDPERARAQLLEARGRGALDHWVGRCWWEIWMCRAELALGRVDEAHGWALQATRTADEMGLVGRRASALSATAAVRLARGENRGAAEDALEAAGMLERGGRPVSGARARVLAARALAEDGERERAVDELERARAEFKEVGAPRLADGAARELRRLGRRVARPGGRGAGADGAASLSEREREIAELVATGLTNRAIAADLHLSEKTVENHLGRVFAKLGISSRAALARELEP